MKFSSCFWLNSTQFWYVYYVNLLSLHYLELEASLKHAIYHSLQLLKECCWFKIASCMFTEEEWLHWSLSCWTATALNYCLLNLCVNLHNEKVGHLPKQFHMSSQLVLISALWHSFFFFFSLLATMTPQILRNDKLHLLLFFIVMVILNQTHSDSVLSN